MVLITIIEYTVDRYYTLLLTTIHHKELDQQLQDVGAYYYNWLSNRNGWDLISIGVLKNQW